MALAFEGKPVFITDSGDNVTSGATGWNTFILRQVLAVPQLTKRFLFSNICDPDTWQLLDSLPSGTRELRSRWGLAPTRIPHRLRSM